MCVCSSCLLSIFLIFSLTLSSSHYPSQFIYESKYLSSYLSVCIDSINLKVSSFQDDSVLHPEDLRLYRDEEILGNVP